MKNVCLRLIQKIYPMITRSIQASQGYDEMQDYGRYEREDEWNAPPERGRSRMQSMNFERYAAEANHFINEVADELGTDNRSRAARTTRAVLHALRDRLIPDEAVQFAQGLPMALKSIYFDQYDISRTPVKIRNQNDFLDYIRSKDRMSEMEDFPDQEAVVEGLRAVFTILEEHMDAGQINKIKRLLPAVIVHLIEY
jgi:uncharacterized protein (DUF2267 family)